MRIIANQDVFSAPLVAVNILSHPANEGVVLLRSDEFHPESSPQNKAVVSELCSTLDSLLWLAHAYHPEVSDEPKTDKMIALSLPEQALLLSVHFANLAPGVENADRSVDVSFELLQLCCAIRHAADCNVPDGRIVIITPCSVYSALCALLVTAELCVRLQREFPPLDPRSRVLCRIHPGISGQVAMLSHVPETDRLSAAMLLDTLSGSQLLHLDFTGLRSRGENRGPVLH
jgi:hypothetical protein